MTNRKVALIGCTAAVALPVIGILAFGLVMSDATEYCPWQHHLSDLSACEVLDQRNGRVLVQHADLDTNVYYIEIIERSGSSTYFDLPPQIQQLAPQGYRAKLIPGARAEMLLNGTRVRLSPLR